MSPWLSLKHRNHNNNNNNNIIGQRGSICPSRCIHGSLNHLDQISRSTGVKAPRGETRTYELGASPDEGQELEVVEAPDALAPRRLHPVRLLQLPHDLQIPAVTQRRSVCRNTQTHKHLHTYSPVKHLEDDRQPVVGLQSSDLAEAAEERSEGSFMTWERTNTHTHTQHTHHRSSESSSFTLTLHSLLIWLWGEEPRKYWSKLWVRPTSDTRAPPGVHVV